MYCTTADAYRVAGITSDDVTEANVVEFIKDAEGDIDRLCNTTFWDLEALGTATSSTGDTLTDSAASFTVDALIGDYVWIYGGTGQNQIRRISDNTTTAVTVDEDWDTNPDTDSTYRIIHTGTDPRRTEIQKKGAYNGVYNRHARS